MNEPEISSHQPINLNSIRSRIAELRDVDGHSGLGPAEETLLNNIAHELENKINWIFSECSSHLSAFQNDDLNEILSQLKKELGEMEAENTGVECEIEELQKKFVEDYDKMESELEKLCCSLEFTGSQTSEKDKENMQIEVSCLPDDKEEFSEEHASKFKMLELSHLIEKNKTTLKSLQDLHSTFKRFEAFEKIENALTGVRVIEIEGNIIRLSLKTYTPFLDSVLRQQDIENVIEPLEMNHELIIETVDGTWELMNVEIFPNDVYIGEIIDAAKNSRQLYSTVSVIETKSSLEWFVRKVQDRIALSSLRRFVVKNANKSRHSFEYLNRDDMVVAHVVGGVNAFIKLPQGWPLSNLPLELISLKSTSQYSKEISLSFLCKIVETANSLNANVRQNISSFADGIEELLMQEMRTEHAHSNIAEKLS